MIKKIFFVSFVFLAIRWQSPDHTDPSSSIFKRLDSLRTRDNLQEWLNTCMEYNEANTAKYVEFLSKEKPQIWRNCRNDSECLAQFYFRVTLGYYQMYTGNILASIESYEEAYRFSVEKKIPDADVLEYVLKPLGNNYTRLGDYDRALFIQQKGLSMALHEKDLQQAASFFSNLTTTSLSKGDLHEAMQFCDAGLQLVKKDTALYGYFLSAQAEVLFESDQLLQAKEKVEKGISVLKSSLQKDKQYAPYWLYGAYRTQGDIFKKENDWTAALQSYHSGEKIIDRYFKGERKREKAKLMVAEGDILLSFHQTDRAIEKYREGLYLLLPSSSFANKDSLPDAGALYGENTLTDALKGMAKSFLQLNEKEMALQCYHLVLAGDQKLQQEFFGNEAKQKQQKETHQWVEDAIETAYQLYKSSHKTEYAEEALFFAEKSKARLLLDEINTNLYYNSLTVKDSLLKKQQKLVQAINFYEKNAAGDSSSHYEDSVKKELQYQLSLVQSQVKEKYPVTSISFDDERKEISLQYALSTHNAVIEFFTGEMSIYVFGISGKKVAVSKIENADSIRSSVNAFVSNWFQNGPSAMMNAPESYYRDAYHLYAVLLQPFIKNDEQYLIIPDGILGYLPFDALITSPVYKSNVDDWPFLIKTTSLYYAYSLQTWQQLHKIKRNERQFTGFFISFDSSAASSLPAVKKEYEATHKVISGNFFQDQKATLQNFTGHLNNVNILHISTHSFLQGEDKIPALQFSDGKFFLFELYGRTFHPQLVVLSACRTGQGMIAEGEGILSLSRGFTASGAGGIIAGLWNMNDEATADLVAGFYQQLQKDHLPAEALRGAKLHWLQQSKSDKFLKLPYYWAGLTYFGDDENVFIEEKNGAEGLLWWCVAGLLLGLILLLRKRAGK